MQHTPSTSRLINTGTCPTSRGALQILVTAGAAADCTQAAELIRDIPAKTLIADKGYDTDAIVKMAQATDIEVGDPTEIQP